MPLPGAKRWLTLTQNESGTTFLARPPSGGGVGAGAPARAGRGVLGPAALGRRRRQDLVEGEAVHDHHFGGPFVERREGPAGLRDRVLPPPGARRGGGTARDRH